MSNRMIAWQKQLMLLAVGGCPLAFGLSTGACATNADLVEFFQAAGSASIAAVTDSASAVGEDFEAIVVDPTTTLLQELWRNWVALQFPRDPEPRLFER